jgi:hypothetical protein
MEENLRDLVGYQRRLHKMSFPQLQVEARRVGASEVFHQASARLSLISNILAAQHLDYEGEEYQ